MWASSANAGIEPSARNHALSLSIRRTTRWRSIRGVFAPRTTSLYVGRNERRKDARRHIRTKHGVSAVWNACGTTGQPGSLPLLRGVCRAFRNGPWARAAPAQRFGWILPGARAARRAAAARGGCVAVEVRREHHDDTGETNAFRPAALPAGVRRSTRSAGHGSRRVGSSR